VKAGGYAVNTGNLYGAAITGMNDAYSILSDRYAKTGSFYGQSSGKPMTVGNVSVPAARATVMRGTNKGIWANATDIKQTADGLIITQRVLMGELIATAVSGSVYLWDSTNTYGTFVGLNAPTSVTIGTAPVFPLQGGGSIDGKYDDVLKGQFLYPSNSLINKIGASFEWFKVLNMSLDFVPNCATTTAGDLSMAWSASDVGEVIDASLYSPYGKINDFASMTQNPYFTSGPLWQPLCLGGVQPMKHGYEDWIRTHFIKGGTGTGAQDSSRSSQSTAGFIVLCVKDNSYGATSYPFGYIYASYTYAFKGQHAYAFGSFGYGSTLPLSEQEINFKEYVLIY